MRRKDTGRRRGRRSHLRAVRKKAVTPPPAPPPSDWPPLLLENPYAGEECAPEAEPSLRDVLLEYNGGYGPQPRLPERRYRDVEAMLSITSPSWTFRGRLYRILWHVVQTDKRINPRQRDAGIEASGKERARRLAAIEKKARELHRLLMANDGDEYERRQDETSLGAVFRYPRAQGAEHPLWDFAATVALVADGARWAAGWGRRRRRQGRPESNREAWLIRNLGDLYMRATEKAPTRTTYVDTGAPGGPFFDFVRYIYNWIGPPYSATKDHALAAQIRKYDVRKYTGRAWRRWEPFELALLATERAPLVKGQNSGSPAPDTVL